jgi:hypothetical protein
MDARTLQSGFASYAIRAGTPVLRAALLCWLLCGQSLAQTPLETAYVSSDIPTRVYQDASETTTVIGDDDTIFTWSATENNAFGVFSGETGDRVDVVGFHLSPRRYAVETSIEIDGVLIQPGDVFSVNSTLTNPVIVFDAADNALPAGVKVDAITVDPVSGNLVLSFDRTVSDYRRADLVRWNGSVYSLYFQGTMLPVAADINGAHILDSGNILMTFESGIAVPGSGGSFYVRDDQVVEFDPDTNLFSMTSIDLNAHPSWRRAGLDALWAAEAGDPIFADRFED